MGHQKGQWTRTLVQGGNWAYSVWKKEGSKEKQSARKSLLRRESQALCSIECERMRDHRHKRKREIQTGYEQKHFAHEDSQALEQVAL